MASSAAMNVAKASTPSAARVATVAKPWSVTSGVYSHPTLSPTFFDTAALASSSRSRLPGPQVATSSPASYDRFTPSYPLRSSQPSSSSPSPHGSNSISDHEFNVRLSRAVSLLRATLSDFMRIGLVDYDTSHVSSSSSSSGLGIPALDRLGLGAILEAFGARSSAKAKARSELPTQHGADDADCPVYHPNIVFKFRPPSASLPNDSGSADAGLVTFSGRAMYFGSAHVLRMALSALFSQTSINLERAHLNKPGDGCTAGREDASLVLRMTFNGVVRVTQQVHEYTVVFKYRFDPETGMIVQHTVDRIEPAPGKKIYAGLAAAFARLAGLQPGVAEGVRNPAPYCVGRVGVRASTAAPAFALLPRASAASSRPISHAAFIERQRRRRGYATQSRRSDAPAHTPAAKGQHRDAAAATTAAAPSESTQPSSSFFSTPTGANDMPGPSLSSFLWPWGGAKALESSLSSRQQRWAPSSDDPTQVAYSPSGPWMHDRLPSSPTSLATYRPAPSPSLTRIIAGLSKARLTFLVTLSGMAGYALCPATLAAATTSGVGSGVTTLLLLTAGTALCSASANAINQLREVPYDAQMQRTRGRLLPSRSVTPLLAASFATSSAVGGVATLSLLSPTTAALGAANIVLYSFIYTPMKRTSIFNTWLGAVVGALPPLMGWSACTGGQLFDVFGADAPAWVLAVVLYCWQFPHFNALAHNLAPEYARGGYRMMSVLNPALNRRVALRHSIALLPICGLALPLSGAVYPLAYAVLSLPPNLAFLAATWRFWSKGDEGSARRCFWVSLVHLPAVMILAMGCKRGLWDWVWGEEQREEGEQAGDGRGKE
ncbi:protoheme IX farnesyltransferase [Jaminaea rosea]|uniref:Protoheme IX farnesyltransferase, mitochondrial n=1 Tax=Jaminaea rosea TaxID=1569628 RepID=A0A316URC0_9BASI|nr:protoheme IX farnesyltransferase [Jaminaea rosea]PWN27836.1 protoheme IX farnesyltransferase [Jaminaea rosea]